MNTTTVKVLDHGYVTLVEAWGSDQRIVEAARMSTAKGFLGWGPIHQEECPAPKVQCRPSCPGFPSLVGAHTCGLANDPRDVNGTEVLCTCIVPMAGDEKLLRYLWKNKHGTPFEMAGAIFEVQAPIFVFREWHRHRTQSYNEMSARYTPLPHLNYIPSIERLLSSERNNKQTSAIKTASPLTAGGAQWFRESLHTLYETQETLYQDALTRGVPKELARIHLPVGRYSRMRASANLRNWLGFLQLRSTLKGPSAQWEIRQFADAVGSMLTEHFPHTMALFADKETP